MIGYITLGTNDVARSAAFYDELLALVGAQRIMETERSIAWGISMDQPALGVITPFDGKPATIGNGSMVGLAVNTPQEVDAIHAKALALGGADEGAPGPRGDSGFYAAYFRDLDGNKLNAFCIVAGGG
ncbi:MAG TPA: VOC family protein [Steroidobacteraceae bacterium]|nr:VOC family protein [Steroidobacteraceae bacterium]